MIDLNQIQIYSWRGPNKEKFIKELQLERVIFLEGISLLSLLNCYPYRSNYVVCKVEFNWYWFLGLPGFIRRFLKGLNSPVSRILFKGLIRDNDANSRKIWMVFENRNARVTLHYSLSAQLGVAGFLQHLKLANINYVVLRNFERLPELRSKDSDLDLLVCDDDLSLVANFLSENSGSLMVDMYGVALPSTELSDSYYPPELAKKILDNRVDGPAGSKVPSKLDYLNSYIYHCLYHKGFASKIPSNFIAHGQSPRSEYAIQKISELALDCGVALELNMESLDAYMAKNGWRPPL